MQFTFLAHSIVGRWRQVLGVLAAVLLLLPLPAFATNFTGVTWTKSGDAGDVIFNNVSFESGLTQTALSFAFNGGQTIGGTNKVVTFTSSSITLQNFTDFNGQWDNLNVLTITTGDILVTVRLAPNDDPNMFSRNLSTVLDSPIALDPDSTSGSATLIVIFNFNANTSYSVSSTPNTILTIH